MNENIKLDYQTLLAYIQGLYDNDANLTDEDYRDIVNFILNDGSLAEGERDLIQIYRGNEVDIPVLAQGEMAFTLDTQKLFIGGLAGNVEITTTISSIDGNKETIQIKRGNEEDIPNLEQGELAFALDTQKLFIGGLAGNEEITGNVGNTTVLNVLNPPGELEPLDNTGNVDSSLKLQLMVNYLQSKNGGKIYFPTGKYLLNNAVRVLNQNSLNKLIDFEGESQSSILLINNANGIEFKGDNVDASIHQHSTISNLQFKSLTNGQYVNRGLFLNVGAFMKIENVYFNGFDLAIECTDLLSSIFDNVNVRYCNKGMLFNGQIVLSQPNNVTFTQVHVALCEEYGITVNRGANVSFFGGSIESCGQGSSVNNKYGIKMHGGGQQGQVTSNFYGVYFENNGGVADVWLYGDTTLTSHAFYSCSFNRVDEKASDTCVRMDNPENFAEIYISIISCAFKNYGTALETNKVFKAFATSPYYLKCFNNSYGELVEAPIVITSQEYACARVVGSDGALVIGTNVKNIERLAVGEYKIVFNNPSPVVSKIYSITPIGEIATPIVFAETQDSVTVRCYNAQGLQVDTSFSITVNI